MLPYIVMDLTIFVIAEWVLCWWIFIVPEVVLNLSISFRFSGLDALISADIARKL